MRKLSSVLLALARVMAWLVVLLVAAWLLSLTLRSSAELNLGRIRTGDPGHELNLHPFSNKLQSLRNLLLSPDPARRRAAWSYLSVDVLGNVAVFVPFGGALAAAGLLSWPATRRRRSFWPSWLGVTAAGLLLSLFIEIAQLAIPSRVTDVDDVILNTLGTAVGALLIWGLFRLTHQK